MLRYKILDADGHLRDVALPVWAAWMEDASDKLVPDGGRVVAKTPVGAGEVSTVFLGIEHVGGIFETMTFGLGEEFQRRYATYADALAGHAETVAQFTSPNGA